MILRGHEGLGFAEKSHCNYHWYGILINEIKVTLLNYENLKWLDKNKDNLSYKTSFLLFKEKLLFLLKPIGYERLNMVILKWKISKFTSIAQFQANLWMWCDFYTMVTDISQLIFWDYNLSHRNHFWTRPLTFKIQNYQGKSQPMSQPDSPHVLVELGWFFSS